MLDDEKIALEKEKLEKITGGGDPRDDRETLMECSTPDCGYTDVWPGDYRFETVKRPYRCPRCRQYNLRGVRFI